jgi:hypothetical protein
LVQIFYDKVKCRLKKRCQIKSTCTHNVQQRERKLRVIIKRRKYLVWPLVMIFLLTQVFITPVIALSSEVGSGTGTAKDRIAGVDRYKTAVAVAQKGWETSDYAVCCQQI